MSKKWWYVRGAAPIQVSSEAAYLQECLAEELERWTRPKYILSTLGINVGTYTATLHLLLTLSNIYKIKKKTSSLNDNFLVVYIIIYTHTTRAILSFTNALALTYIPWWTLTFCIVKMSHKCIRNLQTLEGASTPLDPHRDRRIGRYPQWIWCASKADNHDADPTVQKVKAIVKLSKNLASWLKMKNVMYVYAINPLKIVYRCQNI